MKKSEAKLDSKTRLVVEWALEHYPETIKQISAYRSDKMPSMTKQNFTVGGHGTGEARPTEQIAVELITDQYLSRASRDIAAIERATSKLDRADYQLIALVYFNGSHTVAGAGLVVGMSERTARRRLKAILTRIAQEMGLITL